MVAGRGGGLGAKRLRTMVIDRALGARWAEAARHMEDPHAGIRRRKAVSGRWGPSCDDRGHCNHAASILQPRRPRPVRSPLATLERESSETTMFYLCSIAVFMLLLWALGVATTSTLTSAVGVLAVVAIALFLYRLVQRDRRRPRR